MKLIMRLFMQSLLAAAVVLFIFILSARVTEIAKDEAPLRPHGARAERSQLALQADPQADPGAPVEREVLAAWTGYEKVFLIREEGETRYKLLDEGKEVGWAFYDPANDSWVIEVENYRLGLK